jgi:hypothetical protein
MKPTRVVALILALLAVFPLLRLLLRWDITMNGSPVPMWMSLAAFLLFAAMAATLWREGRRH